MAECINASGLSCGLNSANTSKVSWQYQLHCWRSYSNDVILLVVCCVIARLGVCLRRAIICLSEPGVCPARRST